LVDLLARGGPLPSRSPRTSTPIRHRLKLFNGIFSNLAPAVVSVDVRATADRPALMSRLEAIRGGDINRLELARAIKQRASLAKSALVTGVQSVVAPV
jgi:hypothetical protein